MTQLNIIIRKDSTQAIYEQIVSQIKEHIAKWILKENDALPSIRLLAKNLEVSVITTKRAYDELEREGLIVSVAGKGSYVSGLNKDSIKASYEDEIKVHLLEIKKLANASGMSISELRKLLEETVEWKHYSIIVT